MDVMLISREVAIQRFCALATRVMERKFDSLIPADCFCGENYFSGVLDRYKFDAAILAYIENAVEEQLMISDCAKRHAEKPS
jgi:hypothetical protein